MVVGFAEEGFDVGGLAVFGPAAGPRAVADLVELDREPVQALDRDADAPEPVAEDLAFLTPWSCPREVGTSPGRRPAIAMRPSPDQS